MYGTGYLDAVQLLLGSGGRHHRPAPENDEVIETAWCRYSFICSERLCATGCRHTAKHLLVSLCVFFNEALSLFLPAPSHWRSMVHLHGWGKPSTSCSWDRRRSTSSRWGPASSRLVFITWAHRASLPSSPSLAPCVRPASRARCRLSLSSTVCETWASHGCSSLTSSPSLSDDCSSFFTSWLCGIGGGGLNLEWS